MTKIETADRTTSGEAVGDVLARAFHDDPVVGWLLPDGKGRPLMFATLTRHVHAFADVALDEDGGIAGAALWDPPGHHGDYDAAIPGLAEAMGDRLSRGMLLEETFERYKPAFPYWYLAQIGALPERRGSGVGGALLAAGLARCDAERSPAYLENSKESNLPFYEKYGFVVTERFALHDGPDVWGMLRPPA
ncbi:GNAT family N-acetyltransferase [Nonomuraea antri]|uniref:GNAT family N-acetyltransferase n=1 Tax=Nonomuraea antri TaxID=2730852 RepID=UPI001C2C309D|nr:GNAT family N-acetyltransferase [Nonomuraea antri]